MNRLSRRCGAAMSLIVMVATGCMPASTPPQVDGPLDHNVAAQLQSKIRARHGDKFSIEHEYQGKKFTANWELSNSLKRSAQLQIKAPAQWSEADLYQALEVVLQAHQSKPWYSNIDETVLGCMRRASQDKMDQVDSAIAPGTPYHVHAKVKKHSTEWFLQIKTKILDENGMSLGF